MTMCFAERHAEWKDPRVFGMLGLRNITAFAQVSCFYNAAPMTTGAARMSGAPKRVSLRARMELDRCTAWRTARPTRMGAAAIGTAAAEAWDTWLNPENELRDLEWLKAQPAGRRGLNLGGWFAHETFPESHGHDVAKLLATEIRRLFPTEAQPLDLLYIDHEGMRTSAELIASLEPLAPLCRKVACFNRFDGPGWWGETGKTALVWSKHHQHGPVGVGCWELYGATLQSNRFKRAARMNPGGVPIAPVCTRDIDWSRLAPWSEIVQATGVQLRYWHGMDEQNRVLMVAPYMLNRIEGGPDDNYFLGTPTGPGRSIEYLFELDTILQQLR